MHLLLVLISISVYLSLSCCLTFRKHPQFLSQFARDSQIGCDQSLYIHPLVDARLNEMQRDIPLQLMSVCPKLPNSVSSFNISQKVIDISSQ